VRSGWLISDRALLRLPRRLPVPVDHPVAPFTSYGISKTAGEQYMLLSGLPVVSLRLANVTGPRLAIGPIPTFFKRLQAGQKCFCSDTQRDFLDMTDFLAFMDPPSPKARRSAYNVSTGKGTPSGSVRRGRRLFGVSSPSRAHRATRRGRREGDGA
jgi:nucleoside-diphosphate-sugar epimerase